jgi:hypothetical protein
MVAGRRVGWHAKCAKEPALCARGLDVRAAYYCRVTAAL